MSELLDDRRAQVGERLREERKRLHLTQEQISAVGGVRKQAQLKYEKGDSTPAAVYLAAVAAVGLDVLYVLTGVPSPRLEGEELALLRQYRAAPPAVRTAVMGALGAVVVGGGSSGGVIAGGQQGQVVQGDQTNHEPLPFHVGGKKGGSDD